MMKKIKNKIYSFAAVGIGSAPHKLRQDQTPTSGDEGRRTNLSTKRDWDLEDTWKRRFGRQRNVNTKAATSQKGPENVKSMYGI